MKNTFSYNVLTKEFNGSVGLFDGKVLLCLLHLQLTKKIIHINKTHCSLSLSLSESWTEEKIWFTSFDLIFVKKTIAIQLRYSVHVFEFVCAPVFLCVRCACVVKHPAHNDIFF